MISEEMPELPDLAAFRAAPLREDPTLMRTLTDPHPFSGIGNPYPDEILHRARLSPVRSTTKLSEGEIKLVHRATRERLAAGREGPSDPD